MKLGVNAVVRRSTRARAAPEVYRPAWVASEQGYVNSVDSDVEETREGEHYQAVLPAVRPRPARTPAEEQIWMQPPILTGKGYPKRNTTHFFLAIVMIIGEQRLEGKRNIHRVVRAVQHCRCHCHFQPGV